mmetsp:Transcript_34049/g.34556  ORF Transcript_34049/g.34556 Transcript_34049/m.34556 type:complete len:472 (+) Transcript_34049:74-1489(+)
MGQPISLLSSTNTFYSGLLYYLFGAGRNSPYLLNNESTISSLKFKPTDSEETSLFKQHARIHLFSLSSVFYLYNKPHYRKGSYRDDLIDNLRNVAVPGTGLPLSIVARSRILGLLFLLTTYPAASYAAAIHKWFISRFKSSISEEYATRLLTPDDWFQYWRLNCNVVGLHALLNDMPKGYEMENKWTFLDGGSKLGVPISPFLKTPGLVVKHRNEEGGMGIYFYKNATAGGDWIIQETISNSDWVNKLLPANAPLSTFRVITQSRASINLDKIPKQEDVTALSCVFRAGREGAATDHDSILFDVDVETGLIKGGTTNAHWYRLGLLEALPGRCPWRSSDTTRHKTHPDGDIPVSGNYVPDIKGVLALVEQSHMKMCPDVPLAGWDVVFSTDPKVPICFLEVNLSCNFFRGSFDKKVNKFVFSIIYMDILLADGLNNILYGVCVMIYLQNNFSRCARQMLNNHKMLNNQFSS